MINAFLLILIAIRFLTGLRLLISGRKNNLPNLVWLSFSMFATVIILFFVPLESNPLANLPFSLWIFTIGSIFGQVSLIIFNQLTFYKDRKSPVGWIWIIVIILSALAIYGVTLSESNFKQSPWISALSPLAVLIWGWHGWSAYQALQPITREKTVQDWVKARYQLIVTYAIVLTIGSIASIIRSFFAEGVLQSSLGSLMAIISLISQITSVVLMFLVWALPESFRLWLNRNYQTRLDEQAYEQALSMMNIVGTAMSDDTKLPKTLAIVAIRKAIGHELNTEDSKKIEAYVMTLGYDEWYAFLNNHHLYTFLKDVAYVHPENVIARAKHTLRENQSLFTLQTK
jgi:hypothetical protein